LPRLLVAELAEADFLEQKLARGRGIRSCAWSGIALRNGGTIFSGIITLSRTVSHGSMVGF